jgi:hypothetical protein
LLNSYYSCTALCVQFQLKPRGDVLLASWGYTFGFIDGRSYAAAPMQASTVATPPAVAAKNLGVGLRRLYT